jgi:hypothetical protein
MAKCFSGNLAMRIPSKLCSGAVPEMDSMLLSHSCDWVSLQTLDARLATLRICWNDKCSIPCPCWLLTYKVWPAECEAWKHNFTFKVSSKMGK